MLLVPGADFSCNNNNSPVAYLREVCFRNNQLNKRMVCSEVPAVLEELVNNKVSRSLDNNNNSSNNQKHNTPVEILRWLRRHSADPLGSMAEKVISHA